MAGERSRTCAHCGIAKSIRGVWYLTPGAGGPLFTCETCYRQAALLVSG